MKRLKLTFALTALAAIFACAVARAQVVRVANGFSSDEKSYFEAFEFDFVDEKPEFPGGGASLIKHINETREYPNKAYKMGIEGRVTCSFIVNPNGSISNITVIRGVEQSLNQEAVRILSKMPDWLPGKIHGQTVPVRVICAVPFRK